MLERCLVLFIGFCLDGVLGDPWPWHPVMGIGWMVQRLEQGLRRGLRIRSGREEDRNKKRLAGCVLVLVTLLVSVSMPALLLVAAGKLSPWLKLGLECILCYQMLAMKSLKTESMKVYRALVRQDVEGARRAVSMIVGRDTENLDQEGIIKAAVETVAENTSDGVVAPLFYMVMLGPLGGVFYKAVNTMDSMVGYKNDAYFYLGAAAARLDDLANYLPARLAAAGMLAAAFFLGMNTRQGAYIYRRDRRCHTSPNAAQTEAVCAGALGVQLAGDAVYFGVTHKKPAIGDPLRRVCPEDIPRACHLMAGTSVLILTASLVLLLSFYAITF